MIGSKWSFKIQTSKIENVPQYKARLVARGFTQRFVLDYNETSSWVVRCDSLRTVLAISAKKYFGMLQFDVKTKFLYAKLSQEMFISVSQGVMLNEEDLVCKLQ